MRKYHITCVLNLTFDSDGRISVTLGDDGFIVMLKVPTGNAILFIVSCDARSIRVQLPRSGQSISTNVGMQDCRDVVQPAPSVVNLRMRLARREAIFKS